MSSFDDLHALSQDFERNALKDLLTRIGSALARNGNTQDATLFAHAADAPHPEEHLTRWITGTVASPATTFLVERGRYELTAESLVWDPRFRSLFNIDIRALAQQRLAPLDAALTRVFEDEREQIRSGLRILSHATRSTVAGQHIVKDKAAVVLAAYLLQKIQVATESDPSAIQSLIPPDVPASCVALMRLGYECTALLEEPPSIRTVSPEEIAFGAFEFDPSFDLNPDVTYDPPWMQCHPEWVIDRINEQLRSDSRGDQNREVESHIEIREVIREIVREIPPVRRPLLEAAKLRREQMAQLLGQHTFEALEKDAKEWLEQCQYLLDLEQHMPRPAAIIHAIATAFECQLAAVLYECARNLVASRAVGESYPNTRRKLVFKGRPSKLRTLGEMSEILGAIADDRRVERLCSQMGINVGEILNTINAVRNDRNRSVHEGGLDLAAVTSLCAEWLGPEGGIFRSLVPPSRTAGAQ